MNRAVVPESGEFWGRVDSKIGEGLGLGIGLVGYADFGQAIA